MGRVLRSLGKQDPEQVWAWALGREAGCALGPTIFQLCDLGQVQSPSPSLSFFTYETRASTSGTRGLMFGGDCDKLQVDKRGELAPPCPPYPRKTHRAGLWERAHGTVRRPLPTPFPQASPHFAQRDDRKVTFFPSLHSYLFLGLLWTEKCIKVQGQDSLPCPSTYR